MIRMGGKANVVKKAVAPAIRKGSFFFISLNDSFNDHQNTNDLPLPSLFCMAMGAIYSMKSVP